MNRQRYRQIQVCLHSVSRIKEGLILFFVDDSVLREKKISLLIPLIRWHSLTPTICVQKPAKQAKRSGTLLLPRSLLFRLRFPGGTLDLSEEGRLVSSLLIIGRMRVSRENWVNFFLSRFSPLRSRMVGDDTGGLVISFSILYTRTSIVEQAEKGSAKRLQISEKGGGVSSSQLARSWAFCLPLTVAIWSDWSLLSLLLSTRELYSDLHYQLANNSWNYLLEKDEGQLLRYS